MKTRKPFISIIIPVFNEEKLLEKVVKEIFLQADRKNLDCELVLVENGSTDASGRIIDSLQKREKRIKALHLSLANYGQALKRGYLESTGKFIINFSIDWVDMPFIFQSLPKLAKYDIIMGSKHLRESRDGRSFFRRRGGLLFHNLVHLLFALPYSDTHAHKIFLRKKILPIIEKCRFGGEIFDTELIIRAHRLGAKIGEQPVKVVEERPPRVSVYLRAIFGFAEIIALRIILWRENFNKRK